VILGGGARRGGFGARLFLVSLLGAIEPLRVAGRKVSVRRMTRKGGVEQVPGLNRWIV
jgi:hypothetical protein